MSLSRIRAYGRNLSWGVMVGGAASVAALQEFAHREISIEESLNPAFAEGMHGKGTGETELILTSCPETPFAIRLNTKLFAARADGKLLSRIENPDTGKTEDFRLDKLKEWTCFREKPHVRIGLEINKEQQEALFQELKKGSFSLSVRDALLGEKRAYDAVANAGGPRVPPILDFGPNTAMAYLKFLKLMGSEKIGEIYRATPGPRGSAEIAQDMSLDFLSASISFGFWRPFLGFELGVEALAPTENLYETKK